MNGASAAPQIQAGDRIAEAASIANFTRGFTIEATRPSAEDVAALAAIARPGTRVYISAVPNRPLTEVTEAAARLRHAGLEPVPHIAVRNFVNALELEAFLARLSGDAGVRSLLVIAGDRDQPAGDFRSAIEVIDGGLLQRHGIRRHRHRRLSGRSSAHPAARPRRRAGRQDRGRGQRSASTSTSSRSSASTPSRSSPGSGGCGNSAWIIRCGSDLPVRPVFRRSCAMPSVAGCGPRRRRWRGGPASCGNCSRCRRPMLWCGHWPKRVRTAKPARSRRISFRSAALRAVPAGPQRWPTAILRWSPARDFVSTRRRRDRQAVDAVGSVSGREQVAYIGAGDRARRRDAELYHFACDEFDLAAVEADVPQPVRDRETLEHTGKP